LLFELKAQQQPFEFILPCEGPYIEISGESGRTVAIDENMLLEAMPDFIPFLPRE
jgi:hypothetical protein